MEKLDDIIKCVELLNSSFKNCHDYNSLSDDFGIVFSLFPSIQLAKTLLSMVVHLSPQTLTSKQHSPDIIKQIDLLSRYLKQDTPGKPFTGLQSYILLSLGILFFKGMPTRPEMLQQAPLKNIFQPCSDTHQVLIKLLQQHDFNTPTFSLLVRTACFLNKASILEPAQLSLLIKSNLKLLDIPCSDFENSQFVMSLKSLHCVLESPGLFILFIYHGIHLFIYPENIFCVEFLLDCTSPLSHIIFPTILKPEISNIMQDKNPN